MKTLLLALSAWFAFSNAYAQTGGKEIIYLSSEENRFYQMINQFRAQLNLPQLEMHVYLQNAAKKHSEWMTSQDFLSHYGPTNNKTPFQRMEDEGYSGYTYAGENIACGNGDPVATFRQWAFSPKHLSNMINPHFHHMGISRAGTGRETCPFYWTNDLGSFTNPKLDPAGVTDLNLIAQAVANVSGPLNGNVVQLPTDDSTQTASSPSPANPDSNSGNTSAPTVADASLIQCMVPYKLGKGILSSFLNTDTIVEATRNANGAGYTLQLSYLQNGQASSLAPVYIYNASIVKSQLFPLYLIFAAPSNRAGGFSIQFNTQTNQSQFDPYGVNTSGASGSILCSLKTR
jgi:uncharacterized protein YkwD